MMIHPFKRSVPPVKHIEVKAGNLGTLKGYKVSIPVRRVKVTHIKVKNV